jgi:chromosome segregation ATPase
MSEKEMTQKEMLSAILEKLSVLDARTISHGERLNYLQGDINGLRKEMNQRFEQIEQKMATKEEMNQRFEQIELKMATKEEMNQRFEQIEQKMATKEEVNDRFDRLEEKYDRIVIFIETLNNIIRSFTHYSHLVNTMDDPFASQDEMKADREHVG